MYISSKSIFTLYAIKSSKCAIYCTCSKDLPAGNTASMAVFSVPPESLSDCGHWRVYRNGWAGHTTMDSGHGFISYG